MENTINTQGRLILSSSEFVTSGHPDRLCDNLAAIVINDIQKKDGPASHAAIEVFATHDTIIFSGEAKTTLVIDDAYLRSVVEKGFKRSGYLPEMRRYWFVDQCILAADVKIVNSIQAQSPDIALGTTNLGEDSGYNDQGVYFSSADNTTECMMGTPMYLAMLIGEQLKSLSAKTILAEDSSVVIGPDIKVVVTCAVARDGFTPLVVTAITIAVCHPESVEPHAVRAYAKEAAIIAIKDYCNSHAIKFDTPDCPCDWVINGTGRFVICGQVSDTSMTGRKISVNHPSAGPVWCNKMIGGGSLVKPAHASDLILNLASRYIANVIVSAGLASYVVVGCSGAIGQTKLQSIFIKGSRRLDNDPDLAQKVEQYFLKNIDWAPIAIAKKFHFFDENFDFGVAVDQNFFGHPDFQPWESDQLITEEVFKLKQFLG